MGGVISENIQLSCAKWIETAVREALAEMMESYQPPKVEVSNTLYDHETRYVSFTIDITPNDHLGVDHPYCRCQPIAENPTDFMIRWNAHQSAEQAERAAPRYAGKWPPPNGR